MVISERDSILFTEEQLRYRLIVREFLKRDVVPAYPEWISVGKPSRLFGKQAATRGILGMSRAAIRFAASLRTNVNVSCGFT